MSISGKDGIKAVVMPTFNGKDEVFRVFRTKFGAYARVKGFDKVMSGAEKVPAWDKAAKTTAEDEAETKNNLGYALLLLSIDGKAFPLVQSAVMAKQPEGDLCEAWNTLIRVYESRTEEAKVDLTTEYHNYALESFKTDPEMWFNELKEKRNRLRLMGDLISDTQEIAHILSKMPSEYDHVVATTYQLMTAAPTTVTLESIKESVRRFWKKRHSSEGQKKSSEEAFFTKKFKGNCNKCGKQGHKGADCWSSKKKYSDSNNSGAGEKKIPTNELV
jgi:hypothetical protein